MVSHDSFQAKAKEVSAETDPKALENVVSY